jgi:hypothetical protein
MVIDGEEESWVPDEISKEAFVAQWGARSPFNRKA